MEAWTLVIPQRKVLLGSIDEFTTKHPYGLLFLCREDAETARKDHIRMYGFDAPELDVMRVDDAIKLIAKK